jgi:hypothetical protein
MPKARLQRASWAAQHGSMMTTMKLTSLPLCAMLLCGTAYAVEQKSAAPCTAPGISYWSLLGSVSVGYADGHLRIDKLYAVCLPPPKAPSDSNYAYNPDQGGKLATVVRSADGQVVNTYVWNAENISGLWELSDYKVVGGTTKALDAGRYTLEFQLEGAPFYRFDFSIATLPSDDPYQPAGRRYFIDGPWSGYGNIFYQRNDPESTLRFTTWVQDKAGHEAKRRVPYEAQLVRQRDGKVLGQDKGEFNLTPQWAQADLYFQSPGGDANARLKAAEVLREDGTYRVRLTLDGKVYGEYSFVVKAGAIAVQGLQDDHTESTNRIVDYLYGGRYRSWWIRRAGGDAQVAK